MHGQIFPVVTFAQINNNTINVRTSIIIMKELLL